MAEVISDFSSDSSRYHHNRTMIAAESRYRQRSRSRVEPPPSPRPQPTSLSASTPPEGTAIKAIPREAAGHVSRGATVTTGPPSPPSSSSPNPVSYTKDRNFTSQENIHQSAMPHGRLSQDGAEDTKPRGSPSSSAPITRSARSLDDVKKHGGNTIKVRDLAHIQSFATEEFLSYRGQSGRRRTADDPTLKYEISGMPITDIIEMVAGLLTKITSTNDRQHENLHRPLPPGDTANMSELSSSVLAFHGKNVPSITILSYLSRIHKYCPTTYEVFLSLLVYFDRMTERVNAMPTQALRADSDWEHSRPSSGYSAEGSDLADSPPASRSVPEMTSDLEKAQYTHAPPTDHAHGAFPLAHFFVVDSFNIHRLVIAGVTCASKFFSDVFYTNSRYAKVGGLPLAELNHLELQFLLLNDFRLSVPVEELEAYGTMLVEFYAREVISQRQGQMPADMAYPEDTIMTAPTSP